jgi:phosphate:Na+ symporter
MSIPSASTEIEWLELSLGLLGGMVLFIFSVTLLSEGLKAAGGHQVKNWLSRFTTNRFSGVLTGTAATALVGSSSITIITVIALVNAGLLTFVQSLGVVMGSNIGTTFSSQIFAFDAEKYAPIILLAGLLLKTLGKSHLWRNIGLITFALGLVFFSLDFIGTTMSPLKGYAPFREMVENLENPWLGVLVGALITILIQSSSAMVGIVIALASQGMITLPAAVGVMLGAEIGTCADTLIASIGRSKAALRTGLFHLIFNMATVLVGVLLVEQLILLTRWISGEAELSRQIANAHLLFNLSGVLLLIFFTGSMSRFLQWLVPERIEKQKTIHA